ncbi:MAG TPA: helix-turn-helix domain-containing protein, partial [Bryobacteraceae bacterium]|nr:helix-turn-helix domain-containing protein [Bryobacteraceae bacterium]
SVTEDDLMRLMGPVEVARLLGVSVAWVRDHSTRKSPRIPTVRAGKLLRYRQRDVREFIRVCWRAGDAGARCD